MFDKNYFVDHSLFNQSTSPVTDVRQVWSVLEKSRGVGGGGGGGGVKPFSNKEHIYQFFFSFK